MPLSQQWNIDDWLDNFQAEATAHLWWRDSAWNGPVTEAQHELKMQQKPTEKGSFSMFHICWSWILEGGMGSK